MARGIEPHLPDTTHCQLTFSNLYRSNRAAATEEEGLCEIKRVLGMETSKDSALQGWWRGSGVFANWSELYTMNPKISKHSLFSIPTWGNAGH